MAACWPSASAPSLTGSYVMMEPLVWGTVPERGTSEEEFVHGEGLEEKLIGVVC